MRIIAVGIMGAISLAGLTEGLRWIKTIEFRAKSDTADSASSLDGTIQITAESAQYPTVVPQHKIFELQLNHHFSLDGGGFLTWSLPAGATLPSRDPSIMPSFGSRLRITNYG